MPSSYLDQIRQDADDARRRLGLANNNNAWAAITVALTIAGLIVTITLAYATLDKRLAQVELKMDLILKANNTRLFLGPTADLSR